MRLTTLLPRFGLLIVCLFLTIVTGKMQGEEFDTSLSVINSGVHWSPDNRFIAVGTGNGIYIHEATTLKIKEHYDYESPVTALDWHPNQELIAFGAYNGEINILETNSHILRKLTRHNNYVTDMRWNPDGTYLASKSNRLMFVWQMPTQQFVANIKLGDADAYPGFALTWDKYGRKIAVHLGEEIAIWDADTGVFLSSFTDFRETDILEWSPDNQFIAAGKAFGIIYLYRVQDYKLHESFDADYYHLISLAWRKDSHYLATLGQTDGGSSESVVRIWRMSDDRLIHEIPVGLTAADIYYHALAWSWDGTKLACATDDGKIFIWETENFTKVAEYDGYLSGFLDGEK